jgi:SAM-dependent methyltransferase
MDNLKLKEKYNEMHKQGKTSWFSDGEEERLTIYQMGRPWRGKRVLEVGCGEGHLAAMIAAAGANVTAIDYSGEAVNKADWNYEGLENVTFIQSSYRQIYKKIKQYSHMEVKIKEVIPTYDVVVMQGVLEHLDDPWGELKWMMDHLVGGDGTLITSSPCFLNPRGIIWMTLTTLFDVPMSLTDLHFLHEWEFEAFSWENDLQIEIEFCDHDWAWGLDLFLDYKDRLPKALKDANLHDAAENVVHLLAWLKRYMEHAYIGKGATAVYKLTKKNT